MRLSLAGSAHRTPRAFAAALAALLAACGGSVPVRVGVVTTDIGLPAARLALEAVNRGGGIDGRPLQLVLVRELSRDPVPTVIAHAQRLAADPSIVGVVGHPNSTASLAASVVYGAGGLPQVAPTTTSTLFTRAGPYAFSLVPDDRRQARFLAASVAEGPAQRVALVYSNDDYGRGLAGDLRRELQLRRQRLVFDAPFFAPVVPADLLVLGRSLALTRPTILLWLGRAGELGGILPELRQQLPALRVYASDTFDGPDAYENDRGALTGVRFVRFCDPEAAGVRQLHLNYRAATGHEITAEAILVYDAVGVLAAGLRSGARTRGQMRDYLRSLGDGRGPFTGVAGPIEFRGATMAARSYLMAEVTPQGVRSLQSATAGATVAQ